MKIIEHLIMDDLVVVDLYVAKHLVVRNETIGVVSLECVNGDLHVVADVGFVAIGVDSLVVDVNEVFSMKHYV